MTYTVSSGTLNPTQLNSTRMGFVTNFIRFLAVQKLILRFDKVTESLKVGTIF